MSVFVDTSALFAILDADDRAHPKAKETWERLLSEAHALFTTNYVLVETYALAQRRLGLDAVEVLSTDVAPMLSVLWVGKDEHARAVAALMSAPATAEPGRLRQLRADAPARDRALLRVRRPLRRAGLRRVFLTLASPCSEALGVFRAPGCHAGQPADSRHDAAAQLPNPQSIRPAKRECRPGDERTVAIADGASRVTARAHTAGVR